MRLLQRLSNHEIRLVGPFTDDEIPAYAILSHRWEHDSTQEVNYEDMIQGRGRDKAGFQKIAFCAEQAFKDELEYFWVDTCCINKRLYGEHQSAMESMFRWYQRAAKCYVYLADVPTDRDWDTPFLRSNWFERGWTLQELLAPSTVEFFSSNCVKLGDKCSLQGLIHFITGISIDAINGQRRLSSFSVKERFSWMERRKTTNEEDKVYALLGIFDVELSLCYGQGWFQAHEMLRQAIDAQIRILQDLRVTDPYDDKRRIEHDKGGLLSESVCDWIFRHPDFQHWRNASSDCQYLWIRGDPGKGKTMLVCSVIDELEKTEQRRVHICYFFCSAADARINNATAVLRGLLYMLIDRQPSLVRHIEKQYNRAGRNIFHDVNSWVVLMRMFSDIVQDPLLNDTIFIVDGLDECKFKLDDLLRFIVSVSLRSSRIKWLLASRDWPTIEEPLHKARDCRACI
jgi:hypothetical protein